MIITEEAYLEHHGTKGMKWGVRKTARIQKILDRHQRIAEGTASRSDKLRGANRFIFTKKGAATQLRRGANNQAKMNAGKMRVSNSLSKMQGVRMKDLNFHTKGDAEAKRDAGQKAALVALGLFGAVQVAKIAAAKSR